MTPVLTSLQSAAIAPSGVRRLLHAGGPSLGDHVAAFGPLQSGVDLVRLLEAAGLTGRGGARFPAASKLGGIRGRGAVVVANGSEGEPLSFKDRTLLDRSPHLVLDGLMLVADAVRARRAYLVTADPHVAERVRHAVAERRDRRKVETVVVADRFISGEESAVVNHLNGDAALPSDRLTRVYERGVDRRPTIVYNVETLAHIALLARFGAEWFRAMGTADDPGTFLSTVSGAVSDPGVYEFAHGTMLADVVETAGGHEKDLQAVLVGGFHGAWVPSRAMAHTPMSRTGLAPFGASVGAGVVMALGRDRCGVVESARIATYLADQVAGQCGPCLNGLPRMAEALGRLARGDRDPLLVKEVRRLQGLLQGRGACSHPDGTIRFVSSAMDVFADEVAVHLGGACSVPTSR